MASCYCARCNREQQVCADCTRANKVLADLIILLDDIEHMPLTAQQRQVLVDTCEVVAARNAA